MTKIYEDNFYIAGLQSLYYIGPAHIRELIKKFGSPYDAWEAVKNPNNLQSFTSMTTRYINCVSANANDERLQSIYDKIQEYHMSYLTYLDADFPEILRHIYNPPAIVFMRGNRALLDDRIPKIGIVGARKCSIYGRNVARMLGKELSKYVTVIVSGGARGIDCHSHEGTLSAHGYGIIVMGCGLDIAYPRDNAKLFDRMLQEGGLLLSEYPPGTPPSAKHFPARNRIISGLCKGVIVVEARASSGSLITADMANSEGRDVFVVPCNLLDHVADGNKWLIRQGAHVLTGVEDIVKEYGLIMRDSVTGQLSQAQDTDTSINNGKSVDTQGGGVLSCNLDRSKVLDVIPFDRCITVSDILHETHMPLQQIQPILLDLELEGAIEHNPPRGYINITRSDILVH